VGARAAGAAALAVAAGAALRWAAVTGSGPLAVMALGALAAVLRLVSRLLGDLRRLEAYRAVEGALARLPSEFRVYGTVTCVGPWARPAVADYLVVGERTAWPLVVEETPSAGGAAGRAVARAHRVGEALRLAVAEGGLPVEPPLARDAAVVPLVVTVRRSDACRPADGVGVADVDRLPQVIAGDEARAG
jgi:hypothetical protein